MKGVVAVMAILSGIVSIVSMVCATFMFMDGMVVQPAFLLILSYFFRYRIEWQSKE